MNGRVGEQRRGSTIIRGIRVGASLNEEVDDGDAFAFIPEAAGVIKSCVTTRVLPVDSSSDARVLQQASHTFDFPTICLSHEGGHFLVVS